MRTTRYAGALAFAGATLSAFIHCADQEANPTQIVPVIDAKVATDAQDGSVDAGPTERCTTITDDDGDGLWQCDDDDCAGTPSCIPGATPIAGECEASTDCAASNGKPLCKLDGYPRGYCSEFCSLSKQDCPVGSRCLRSNDFPLAGRGDRGYCFRTCNRAALDAGDASAGCPPPRVCAVSNVCVATVL